MRKRPLYRLPRFGRMEFRRIVFGALGLYVLALTLLCWFFTQRFAWQLDFHPNLGAPWLELPPGYTRLLTLVAAGAALTALVFAFVRTLRRGAIPLLAIAFLHAALALGPLYTPFHFLVWAWRYRHEPELEPMLSGPLTILAVTATVGLIALVLYLAVKGAGFREKPDTHGSAHWASDREVREAGLLDGNGGLLLGLWKSRGKLRYLRHEGPEHVFVFAPTRTGKGVGLVIPNLLTWPHSVLVHDIKGENWALSAGWRSRELGSC